MTYTIRYQVFLSSTYTDLKEERAEVIQALWELDCIPTGMEAFLASNASQWQIIKKVIDESDYYILIIGGRYGSVTEEDISYTEKEYDYARSINIPVLAFVHAKPEDIASGKSEKDPKLAEKLKKFRERVMEEYPVRTWSTAEQLGSVASRSLIQEIRRNPRTGWAKNDGQSPTDLLAQIASLTKTNAELSERLASSGSRGPMLPNLSGGSDRFQLQGTVRLRTPTGAIERKLWSGRPTWNDIFSHIAPILVAEGSETDINSKLKDFVVRDKDYPFSPNTFLSSEISNISSAKVIVQLRALGLLERGIRKRNPSDVNVYWKLTDAGDDYLVNLLAVRKPAEVAKPVEKNELDVDRMES